MSKPITIGQSHNVISILANNADWNALANSGDALQAIIDHPQESGEQFTLFLKNSGKMIVGEPRIIPIDRTAPFDPVKLLGQGWTIEEQDERSLALTQVNLANVWLEHMLNKGEDWITGEEKLRRLKKANSIRLDAKVFQTLWEDKSLIPEAWKKKTKGNAAYIFFDGTVLRDPDGSRCVLYLCWRDGQWRWNYYWLDSDWSASDPSAVLASI
ncbi:MAG: hypothetical protein AAB451_00485 [Patescibacteria group bacterium]